MVNLSRFDDLIRSERYFTATLLPALLVHEDMTGVRLFLDLIDTRAAATEGGATEYTAEGKRVLRQATAERDFTDPEIITEFHIARDLGFAGATLAASEAGTSSVETPAEKRDAPDDVLVLGTNIVVIEGKFYSTWNASDLNAQLRSQRRQVRHLFAVRPSLRAYTHVALVPHVPAEPLDCNVVLTWRDITDLATMVLGTEHYITRRLDAAVARYRGIVGTTGVANYDGKLPLLQMLAACRQRGDGIEVGHDGGEANLLRQPTAALQAKPWKWRDPRINAGKADRANWIPGTRFLVLIEALSARSGASESIEQAPSVLRRNYDGDPLPLAAILERCSHHGDEVWIGHTGGASDLYQRGIVYARQKRWKYRTRNTPGAAIEHNWIPGRRFLTIIADLERFSAPS